MTESAEVVEEMPSPWWPCPECGGIEFRAVVLFERGQWIEYGTEEEYEFHDPPEGHPDSVRTDDVICEGCGHRFNIHQHYGWPESEVSR